MKDFIDQNYYEILEIPQDVHPNELRRAYEKAKMTYSGGGDALYSVFTEQEAGELIKLIEEAYSVLSNPKLRASYDERINRRSRQTEVASVRMPNTASAAPAFAPQDYIPKKVDFPVVEAVAPDKDPIKGGVGRTLVGTYVVDPQFEQTIVNNDKFDGSFLRSVREYRQVSLDQMSQMTRIGTHYLQALEDNDYTSLPAAVFVRGFVVQYARALKLEPERVAKSFMKIFKEAVDKK